MLYSFNNTIISYICNKTSLVDVYENLKKSEIISFDCEGTSLDRNGQCTILSIYNHQKEICYIIDLLYINKEDLKKYKIKDIFESMKITKLVFDGRNDCDILKHQYDIYVKKVLDLQVAVILYEKNISHFNREYLPSYETCVQHYGEINKNEMIILSNIKNKVKNLSTTPKGNKNFMFWEIRPLSNVLLVYSSLDVKYMINLYNNIKKPSIIIYPAFILLCVDQSLKRINKQRNSKDLLTDEEKKRKHIIDFL